MVCRVEPGELSRDSHRDKRHKREEPVKETVESSRAREMVLEGLGLSRRGNANDRVQRDSRQVSGKGAAGRDARQDARHDARQGSSKDDARRDRSLFGKAVGTMHGNKEENADDLKKEKEKDARERALSALKTSKDTRERSVGTATTNTAKTGHGRMKGTSPFRILQRSSLMCSVRLALG